MGGNIIKTLEKTELYIIGKEGILQNDRKIDTLSNSASGVLGARFANPIASTIGEFSSAFRATFVSSPSRQLGGLGTSEKESSRKGETGWRVACW